MSRAVLAAVVAAGCGSPDASPPDARPRPDLDDVEPEFRGSTASLSDTIGVAYQLPIGDDAASQAIRAFAVPALEAAGIGRARADLLWHEVEPAPGRRDFSAFHAKVDALAGAGVATLPILCYGNPWANDPPATTTTPPDDPADFAAFAGAAAADFAGTLDAYEIWNEQNLGFRFWEPREDPGAYGALLIAASAAIRDADPDALVVLGGLLFHGQLGTKAEFFLHDLYNAHPEVGAAYDVLAFHPYALYPPAAPPELDSDHREVAAARMVARLRAVLEYDGDDPARPIWATEVGWPTYGDVDEERQARWTIRAILLLAGAGVERVDLYTLFDGPDPTAFPPEDAFGLFRYDDPADGFAPEPKLAWTALGTLLAVAGSLAVTEDVTAELGGAPADAVAYRLTGAGARRVTVVWRGDDAAAPVDVTVPVEPAAPLEVVDLIGAALPATPTVAVSGRPVYVIENP